MLLGPKERRKRNEFIAILSAASLSHKGRPARKESLRSAAVIGSGTKK